MPVGEPPFYLPRHPGFPRIQYTEHVEATDGPEAHFSKQGTSASRVIDVNFGDHFLASMLILGRTRAQDAFGDGLQYVIRRFPPWPHPNAVIGLNELEWYPLHWLWATSIDMKPIKPEGVFVNNATGQELAGFDKARLRVHYSTLPYNILTDDEMFANGFTTTYTDGVDTLEWPDESTLRRYCTKRVSPSGESLPVRTGIYKWVDGRSPPRVVQVGIPKIMPSFNLKVTWHDIPQNFAPCSAVNNCINAGTGYVETTLGKVNNADFNGYPKGSLLLIAAELNPQTDNLGLRTFDISYFWKFLLNAAGGTHTHLFDADTPGWLEVSTDGITNLIAQIDGKSIYNYADYTKLFQLQHIRGRRP